MRRVALRSLFAAMALTGGALDESPANAQSSYVIGYITDLSGPLADLVYADMGRLRALRQVAQ